MKHKSITERLLPKGYELIDGTDEIFELDLALWEYEHLSKGDLLKRSAYFRKIKDKPSVHYLTCNYQKLEEIHKKSSIRARAFFTEGKYSTGYATHSLFPYRGKFHPQMIRALLNIIGIKSGDVVLDPMSGSGTLSVEANLLGIDSIGVDISPFCCLMGRVKTSSLNLDKERLSKILKNSLELFNRLNVKRVPAYFLEERNTKDKIYYEVALLAFLDAMGFARRSNRTIRALFPLVLDRYILTIENFQQAREKLNLKIGKSQIIQASALDLPLDSDVVDCVVTSPPYSFAIDYVENDRPQLEYLGFNPEDLKGEMIGLQGGTTKEKLRIYFKNLQTVLKEISRVTKKKGIVVVIIGSNDIQTEGVKLESQIRKIAEKSNLEFSMEMTKPIKGLSNTMKNESILFFKSTK